MQKQRALGFFSVVNGVTCSEIRQLRDEEAPSEAE